jgi:hypothetical protein
LVRGLVLFDLLTLLGAITVQSYPPHKGSYNSFSL